MAKIEGELLISNDYLSFGAIRINPWHNVFKGPDNDLSKHPKDDTKVLVKYIHKLSDIVSIGFGIYNKHHGWTVNDVYEDKDVIVLKWCKIPEDMDNE